MVSFSFSARFTSGSDGRWCGQSRKRGPIRNRDKRCANAILDDASTVDRSLSTARTYMSRRPPSKCCSSRLGELVYLA